MLVRGLLPIFFAGLPVLAQAAASAPAADSSIAGGLLQVFLALLLILFLIVAAAWLMRRFSLLPTAAGGLMRVVSGVMVGQRERVVIVEVQGQWLVLGVTAQNVNLLSSFPRPAEIDSGPAASPMFAEWLARALRRRDGAVPDGMSEKK